VFGTLARPPAPVKQVSSSARPFTWISMSTVCGQRCGNDVHLWGGCCGAFRMPRRVGPGGLWKPPVHSLLSLLTLDSTLEPDPVIRTTLMGSVNWSCTHDRCDEDEYG
jgi:hypothetical protein